MIPINYHHVLLFIMFGTCFTSTAFAQTTSHVGNPSFVTKGDQAIMKFEREWMTAELLPDTVAMRKLLDASFIAIDETGVTSKQEEIATVYQQVSRGKSSGIRVDSFRQTNFTIKNYGQSAVVTFECFTYGQNSGVPFTRHSRFYDVLIKRNGTWKAASSYVMRGLPVETAVYRQLTQRSSLWNEAYNKRDSVAFYSLMDTAITIASASGTQVGQEQCKSICRKLYVLRPDITWVNQASAIDINYQWQIAVETGNWTETWTEKGDDKKSQIKGKYTIMWRFENDNWYITFIVFTPLQCTGTYCNKN